MYEFEEWKPAFGYYGYEVSTYGRIKSIDRVVVDKNGMIKHYKGKILSLNKNNVGYYYIKPSNNGKAQKKLLHLLIAKTFIPNPYKLPEINHKDQNQNNCCVWNLEWCTRAYNNSYADKVKRMMGTRKEKCYKNAGIPIIQLTKNGEFINEYQSAKEAERITGISNSNIIQCCKGKLKTTGGFVWKYKEVA